MTIIPRVVGGLFAATVLMAMPAAAQTGGDHMEHAVKTPDHAGPGKMKHGGGSAKKVGDADDKKMTDCKAMPHADAMKDAGCATMMKAHPDMMHKAPPTRMM